MTRTRSAPLFLVPPTKPTLRCCICHRSLPEGAPLLAVIRGLVSAWVCSRRCAPVFFRDGARDVDHLSEAVATTLGGSA